MQKIITSTKAFENFLDESNRKSKKIWVDIFSEFYNRSFKLWVQENHVKINSTHNKGKSVVIGRFVRTLKNKSYKYITLIKKCVFDKLNDIVDKHNNTYHRTIKIKPNDVKTMTYIELVAGNTG